MTLTDRFIIDSLRDSQNAPQPVTLDDLRTRAVGCPILAAMFGYIDRGVSTEEAMRTALMFFSNDRNALLNRLIRFYQEGRP